MSWASLPSELQEKILLYAFKPSLARSFSLSPEKQSILKYIDQTISLLKTFKLLSKQTNLIVSTQIFHELLLQYFTFSTSGAAHSTSRFEHLKKFVSNDYIFLWKLLKTLSKKSKNKSELDPDTLIIWLNKDIKCLKLQSNQILVFDKYDRINFALEVESERRRTKSYEDLTKPFQSPSPSSPTIPKQVKRAYTFEDMVTMSERLKSLHFIKFSDDELSYDKCRICLLSFIKCGIESVCGSCLYMMDLDLCHR